MVLLKNNINKATTK